MTWKSFLKKYFDFTRSERNGILVLCVFITGVFCIKLAMPWWMEQKPPDISAFENEIALFRKVVDSVQIAEQKTKPLEHFQPAVAELFYFDPNAATDKDLERLGLNSRQVKNIRNYQAKGGHFRVKEDVRKLYSISSVQYEALEPYIRIPDASTPTVKPAVQSSSTLEPAETKISNTYLEKSLNRINLNSADSAILTQLPGIGPILASRIVKYRNRIGGYTNVSQLGEVYGIKPELAGQLSSRLSVDSVSVRKISINTATFKDLVSHPYFNEQQTRGILHYRKLQGHIKGMDELVRNNILTREEADQVKLYISFEE